MHTLECTAQRPLLSALLDSDEQAAAVDRFARWHDAAAEPALGGVQPCREIELCKREVATTRFRRAFSSAGGGVIQSPT